MIQLYTIFPNKAVTSSTVHTSTLLLSTKATLAEIDTFGSLGCKQLYCQEWSRQGRVLLTRVTNSLLKKWNYDYIFTNES